MNVENTEKLFAEFPRFLNPYHLRGGFECGNGWLDLIWELCEGLERLHLPAEWHATQVKEKFGGLRFYCSSEPEAVRKLILAAELRAVRTCERCGEPGEPRGGDTGWIRTECEACQGLRLDA